MLLAVFFSVLTLTVSAQNFTVTSNGDTHATAPANVSGGLDAGGQTTLRSALEAATAIAGSHIITIPGSITTINLTLGQITVGSAALGNNITINGGGKAVLTINQTTVNRIFITGTGAITFNLNDVTLNYSGPIGSFGGGGGAIQSGGINANTTLTNVAINNFNIQAGNGGAILCSTANTNNFTATNCDFNNNTAGGGGGAVSIVTNSTASFTNCKFTNNSTGAVGATFGGSGGALLTSGTGNGGTYTVTNCTFTNNQSTNPTPQPGGIAFNTNGTLNLSFCRFVGNSVSGGGNGQAFGQAGGGTLQAIVAQNNWWGDNDGPAANDLLVTAAPGTITVTKWLQLKTSISVNPLCTGGSATVTASFLSNSAAEAVTTANVSTLLGLPISFVNPTLGSLSGAQPTIQNSGTATVTFTAGGTGGAGSVNAVVDNIPNNDVAPAQVSFTINPGAAVTGNPSNVSVAVGNNANFTASFSGTPIPTIQWQVSTNGGANYSNIPGATSSPLTFATVSGDNGNLYRAVGTNSCGSATTTGALLTVTGGCASSSVISVSGATTICAGEQGNIKVTITGGASPYAVVYNDGTNDFSVPGYTSGSDIPVSPTTNTSYTLVSVTDANSCAGSGNSGTATITVNPAITAGITNNSGTTQLGCGVTSINVTATGGVSYSWDGGATPGTAANSFNAPGTYTVVVTGLGGCTSQAQITITTNPGIPATPGPFTGPVNVCIYVGTGTELTYSVPSVPGTTYTWVVPTTVNIVNGQGTSSLTVTLSNGFVANPNKQLRLTASNACGTSPLAIFYLLAQVPNTPAPITATGIDVCPIIGTPNTYTYSISPVIGTSSYLWTAGTGATINHPNGPGVNDTTITVSFDAGFSNSNITVQSVNQCGTSINARSIAITRNNPSVPGLITGPTNTCAFTAPNGIAATYTVNNVAGNTYNWTLPAGATGVTGQGTNSISFIYPNGFTSGSVSVTATNNCGTSGTRSLAVARLNPATPGTIDVIQTGLCPNRVYTYTIANMPANVTSLLWTVPAEALSFTGQGTTSISVIYPSTAVNGTVTVTGVSNCSNSALRQTTVKLAACPPDEFNRTSGGNKSKVGIADDKEMEVTIMPNPTIQDFKVIVKTVTLAEPILMRLIDMQGKELRSMRVLPNSLTSFGSELKAGTYLLEVIQGQTRKLLKLVKF